MSGAEKVRSGLYRLTGVTHSQPRSWDEHVCGGQIFAAGNASVERQFRWECFCEKCKDSDSNGWATLRECIERTPEYWIETTDAS